MEVELYPFWWGSATTINITADPGGGASPVNSSFPVANVHLSSEGVSYEGSGEGEWGPGFIPWSHVVNVTKAS